MAESRIAGIEQYGYRVRIISADHLADLEREISTLETAGCLDERLRNWLKGYYRFALPNVEPAIKSLVAVASRSPQVRFHFTWNENKHALILPPTYIDFVTEAKVIAERLGSLFADSHFHFYEAKNLPNKLIASGSGLGQYGKNNLVYVDGLGSFVLLTVFYTDMPCTDELWRPVKRMEACDTCNMCMENCPTSAITAERKTIRSSRCLTTYNESADSQAFPSWMDRSAHNSIVGCMRCQAVCPRNRKYLDSIDDHAHFSEEETRKIVNRERIDLLPISLLNKLENANLLIHYEYLARNLSVLLN